MSSFNVTFFMQKENVNLILSCHSHNPASSLCSFICNNIVFNRRRLSNLSCWIPIWHGSECEWIVCVCVRGRGGGARIAWWDMMFCRVINFPAILYFFLTDSCFCFFFFLYVIFHSVGQNDELCDCVTALSRRHSWNQI